MEILWQQKSRAVLLKKGDNNTKVFHRLVNSHRNANFIGELEIDGSKLSEETELKDEIVQF